MTTTAAASALDPQLRARLAALPTANIADAMDRLNVMESIRPMWPGARLVARAFTILTRSGDNACIHEALEVASPGEALVVNGFGDESRALIGELIAGRAKAVGLTGFVIDGAVRDVDDLGRLEVPTFARAVTPAGPYKHGPGKLQVPIAVGRVCVCPGDVVVGDSDGVVVVPYGDAEDVLRRAEEIFQNETVKRAAIGDAPTPGGDLAR